MISYDPFWETLKRNGITQYQLINKYHISAGQLSRMRSNSYISTHTVDILCQILDCPVEDIMKYKKNSDG
ncbi:helix-turn-helix domain-containing protein [Coprobacter fastidiosus]|uniref:helix-turn-helix domain-containing protein n=1 Tax=Coprobacter fastidiosus TaxID=1099853 RepID=UPI003207C8C7